MSLLGSLYSNLFILLFFLAVAILPVFFIARYVYKKDKDREPISFLIKLAFAGALISIPILIVESVFLVILSSENSNLMHLLLEMLIGVALVEEFFKWIVVYKVSFNERHFDSYYDSIVYSIFVSLGFAVIENILYVLSNDLQVGFLRAVTAIPLHASCGLIMGYFLGRAKQNHLFNNKKEQNKNLVFSLLFPILLHGIYNFLMLSNVLLLQLIGFVLVAVMNILFVIKIKKISSDNFSFNRNDYNFICTNCGGIVVSNFCQRCGIKKDNLI